MKERSEAKIRSIDRDEETELICYVAQNLFNKIINSFQSSNPQDHRSRIFFMSNSFRDL